MLIKICMFYIECKDISHSLYTTAVNLYIYRGHMHTKTKNGDQGLHIACRHKRKTIVPIVEFLINQGADQRTKDSQNKCLKDYMKENILLKNVIANAKKTQTKYANVSTWSAFGGSNSSIQKSNSSVYSPHSSDSFGVLDLKGQRLYSASGYKIDQKHNKTRIKSTIIKEKSIGRKCMSKK